MKKQISEWIHINEIGGDPWILPIWGAVQGAERAGKIKKLPQKIYELGMHISIRLNMLPKVFQRINTEYFKLCENLKNVGSKNRSTRNKNGYAYEIDNNLKYEILIDIDALLFELNSCCELMCKLIVDLYKHADKHIMQTPGVFIKELLKKSNSQIDWFVDLHRHRNFFIHEGAPYIAIDISNRANNDLIIMKENLKTFDDPDKFLLLSEVNIIIQGFINSKPVIQKNLIDLFKKL